MQTHLANACIHEQQLIAPPDASVAADTALQFHKAIHGFVYWGAFGVDQHRAVALDDRQRAARSEQTAQRTQCRFLFAQVFQHEADEDVVE
jgi:hypothetical protein